MSKFRARPDMEQLVADARMILQGKMRSLDDAGVEVSPFLLGNVGFRPTIDFLVTVRGEAQSDVFGWVEDQICLLYDFDSNALDMIRTDSTKSRVHAEPER